MATRVRVLIRLPGTVEWNPPHDRRQYSCNLVIGIGRGSLGVVQG